MLRVTTVDCFCILSPRTCYAQGRWDASLVGDERVRYSSFTGRVIAIGERKVTYDAFENIMQVGDDLVEYVQGRLTYIGPELVQYTNNRMISIGDRKITCQTRL